MIESFRLMVSAGAQQVSCSQCQVRQMPSGTLRRLPTKHLMCQVRREKACLRCCAGFTGARCLALWVHGPPDTHRQHCLLCGDTRAPTDNDMPCRALCCSAASVAACCGVVVSGGA